MNNLSNERLKEVIDGDILYCDEQRDLARELLALRKAGKEPVAYIAECGTIIGEGSPFFDDYKNPQPLYAAPQLPAPADLLSMAASAIEDLLEHTDPNTSYYSGVWADVPGKLRAAIAAAPKPE